MTCIVGLEDRGDIIVGGDSAGVSRLDLRVRGDSKVFARGHFLMGFTTSFRMGQLLRWRLDAPEHPDGMSDSEYLATLFVDAVRQCLKDGGFASKNNEAESGGQFLVGYRRRLYVIHSDYQVEEPSHGFAAAGCGEQIAHGALYATPGLSPRKRVQVALEAAEEFSAGVRRPFLFLRMAPDGALSTL